jgi:hippurate hydrolase
MHACGHDAHLACALGAAAVLARHRGVWSGSVVVVGQPAEETLVGAAAMLGDGLYDRFGVPDVMLAQHLAPFPVGSVAHAPPGRATLGAGVSLRVTMTGASGHVADHSARTANSVDVAAHLATALPGAMPAGATLTVTGIQAGVAHNIVPEHTVLTVSIRAPTAGQRDEALAAATALCGRAGAARVTSVAAAEPTVCDADRAEVVRRAHRAAIGSPAVLPLPMVMAVDDFHAFARGGEVPIVYWMLGCVGRPEWADAARRSPEDILAVVPNNHSPRFAPSAGPTVRTGIVAMTSAALACLGGPPVGPLPVAGLPIGGAPVSGRLVNGSPVNGSPVSGL